MNPIYRKSRDTQLKLNEYEKNFVKNEADLYYVYWIKILNSSLPVIFLLLGTFGNVLTMYVFLFKNVPGPRTFFISTLAAVNTASLYLNILFHVDILQDSYLICRLHAFLLHLCTWTCSWLIGLSGLATYIKLAFNVYLKDTKFKIIFLFKLILVLASINLVDFVWIESVETQTRNGSHLKKQRFRSKYAHEIDNYFKKRAICVYTSNLAMYFRDVLDMVFFYFLPFLIFFLAQIKICFFLKKNMRKFKKTGLFSLKNLQLIILLFVTPSIFTLFNSSIIIATFLNSLIFKFNHDYFFNNYFFLKFLFLVVKFFHMIHFSITFLLSFCYHKLFRNQFLKMLTKRD
jgi:hypothetical protein